MTSLSDKFKRAVEFEPCEISKTNNQYKHGRRRENDRLKPIHAAVAEVIEAAEKISQQTESRLESCPGNHSYYSSMHPNADVTCPICGGNEDGLGNKVARNYPTSAALTAREALANLEKVLNEK